MPNWTTPAMPTDNIIRRQYWQSQVIDNEKALNDIIGHTDGGNRSLTDGGILLGNGEGAIQAMSVLAKGSVVAGDGATDPAEVTVANNDDLFFADSGETPGVGWDTINWRVAEEMLYG